MNHNENIPGSFTLEKLTEFLNLELRPEELAQLRFDIDHRSDLYRHLTLRIKREFFGERRQEEVEVDFKAPTTWWDHFKQDKFPAFLLKRFPVKYKTTTNRVILNRTWYFPNVPVTDMTKQFLVRDFHQIIN